LPAERKLELPDKESSRMFIKLNNSIAMRKVFEYYLNHSSHSLSLPRFHGTLADGTRCTSQQRFVNQDTFTWTFIAKDKSGKLILDMEGKCVRRK